MLWPNVRQGETGPHPDFPFSVTILAIPIRAPWLIRRAFRGYLTFRVCGHWLGSFSASTLNWEQMGRTITYSDAVADEILTRLAAGETLRGICKSEGMPDPALVVAWQTPDRREFRGPEFAQRYARSRIDQLESWADQCILIADD